MSEQTLFLGYIEKDVPATQDEYQKGVFLSWLSYHWRGKETGEFQKQYGRSKSENLGVKYCNTKLKPSLKIASLFSNMF